MIAAIVFLVFCIALGGGLAACGIGRLVDRDEPVQGIVDLALAGVTCCIGATALLRVMS